MLIRQAWRDQQVPLVDGVVFATGLLYPAEYFELTLLGVGGIGARIDARAPIFVDPSVDFVTIDELAAQSDRGNDMQYSCGEGSFGSDGFLARTRLSTGELEWVAFFQQSNPFVQLAIVDDRVNVTNNHGHIWSFGKDDPLEIRIRGT